MTTYITTHPLRRLPAAIATHPRRNNGGDLAGQLGETGMAMADVDDAAVAVQQAAPGATETWGVVGWLDRMRAVRV